MRSPILPSLKEINDIITARHSADFWGKMFLAQAFHNQAAWLEIAGDQKGADELRNKYPYPKIGYEPAPKIE